MNDDTTLLREYVREGSEPAFRGLVERHIALVNSTARRMVGGDVHLAQDVTQLVFTDLARKAAALPEGVVLGGWLHRHTCFAAAKAVRTECRRRARERTAMEINAINDNSGQDAAWQQLAPVLDDALNRLSANDRDAIVLRYLQQHDLRSIGETLGVSDDTVQKRISRALEKLRAILTRRGITLSTALLATTLDAGAAPTVSSGLAATVSTTAISSSAQAAGFNLTSLRNKISNLAKVGLVVIAILIGIAIFIHLQRARSISPISWGEASVSASTQPSSTPAANAQFSQVKNPLLPTAPASNVTSSPPTSGALVDPAAGSVAAATTGHFPMGVLIMSTNSLENSGLFSDGKKHLDQPTFPLGNSDGSNTSFTAIFATANSNGTITLIMRDGTTQNINDAHSNDDGTLTLTLLDGTTHTINDADYEDVLSNLAEAPDESTQAAIAHFTSMNGTISTAPAAQSGSK